MAKDRRFSTRGRRGHRRAGTEWAGTARAAIVVFALLALAANATLGASGTAAASTEGDRSVVLVPPLPGHDENRIEAFNDAAQVAGYSWDSDEPGERRAFRFDPDGTLHDLGSGLDIAGMDEQGRVAGTIEDPAQRAVLWTEDDGLRGLGLPGADEEGATSKVADVAGGYLTGWFAPENGKARGFLWDIEAGTAEVFAYRADAETIPELVNPNGLVVGSYQYSEGWETHNGSFTWTKAGGVDELPWVPGTVGWPSVFDLNDRGDVIGEFRVGWGTYGQGYVRLAGQAWHRLVPEAVTHPTTAYAINGRGTVLGLFGGRNANWTANEFVWSSDIGRRELPVDFTAAPYRNWQPSMLNDLDQVAGTTWEGDDDLAARYTIGGELEVVPVPTDHAYGTHINERGDVAGLTDQDELQGVFVWADITLPVRPAWPAGAALTVVPGSESLEVSWPAASIEGGGTVSYRVSLDGGTPVVESGTSIVLSGLTPGTAYTVRVVPLDADGVAGPVLSAVARTTSAGGGEPTYVTSLLTTYATTVGWEAHRAGDVTGNGYADLVSYHPASGRWVVTESLGAGSFAVPRTLTTYGTTTGWSAHLVGDVTGNGYADLLSYHPVRGRWWVTESLGAGSFAAPRLLTTYATTEGWSAHLVGDVTGNGYADLVSYHAASGRWWVTESLGAGAFASPALLSTYATTEGWDSHLVGDVTGNGFADLVSYHPKRGRWWVTESLGAGSFAAPRLLTTYATTEGWSAHLAADVTGDEVVDLVSYQPTTGRWWMSRGLGDGGVAAPKVLTTYNTLTGWDTHLAADVTGNGAADLLSYHPSRGRWWVTTDTSR